MNQETDVKTSANTPAKYRVLPYIQVIDNVAVRLEVPALFLENGGKMHALACCFGKTK